jgi:starch synthase/alpha-amylase
MTDFKRNPRVLIVTPEVAYLPHGMDNVADYLTAKASGLADVSAALINALFEQGANVYVSIPDYRSMFNGSLPPPLRRDLRMFKIRVPKERLHLAEDSAFFYLHGVYSNYWWENRRRALAFQREIINSVIPYVQPDLIHCYDCMTGLIPAMARQRGIPCLFTFHNLQTVKCPLFRIEDRGIDAAEFWQHLYFERMPCNYEETRETNPVDFLASGIFAAHFVNTVSPAFLGEVAGGRYGFVPDHVQQELASKISAGCAVGILNAPEPSFNPTIDKRLAVQYGPQDHAEGKKKNKRMLQKSLSLIQDDRAPLFFWPSPLNTVHQGCQLLADILYNVVATYWAENLEIVFVAGGTFQKHFKDIVQFHNLGNRIAVCNYNERLSRLAYAASDFVLTASSFGPFGLPQMIGPIYGSPPVTYAAGGIHDAVLHLDVKNNTGNGFIFEVYNSQGLFWAIRQAMKFYKLPAPVRQKIVGRIMTQSAGRFNHMVAARRYIELYEKMLQRPLINSGRGT